MKNSNEKSSNEIVSRKVSSRLLEKIISLISFCSFSMGMIAQNPAVNNIQGLDSKLISMRQSAEASIQKEAENLSSLVNDLKPTLYYRNYQVIQSDDGIPVRINADAESLQLLAGSNPLFSQVQLLCIKIEKPEDIQSVLDLSDMTGFLNLKYIYFLCTYQLCADQPGDSLCEKQKIAAMLQGNETAGLNILYAVNIDN